MHPWTFGWDALVALGTILLALVTVGVGIVAVRGNKTARDALTVAQAELQASMFPLLESVPVEFGEHRHSTPPELVDYGSLGSRDPNEWRYRDVVDYKGEPGGVFFSVPIRNVGPGMALIAGARPRALSVPDVIWTLGECSRPLIPPGGYARLKFRLSGLRQEAYAEVFYSDVSGSQKARLRLYVKGERATDTGEMGYLVQGSALYTDDGDVPFAISGDQRVADEQPTPIPEQAAPADTTG